MKTRWFVLLAALSVLTLAGYFFLNEETGNKPQEPAKRDLVISQTTVQGMLNATFLYENGTFLVVNEFPDLSVREPLQCYEGEISGGTYDSFISYLTSANFMELEASQWSWKCLRETTPTFFVKAHTALVQLLIIRVTH
ncbi:MAG: hypothetical protein R6U28_00925 [Cyclonatronaceae bacterium]